MHAANNGSTGIGKKIDSAKDKPNKTLFVVLLEEISWPAIYIYKFIIYSYLHK
mgnify:CR=1 FL=1